jgi:hypothetical protein
MPTGKRPRRPYRPRLVNAPITQGLLDMFEECFRLAETGLHLRAPTADHFDAIATLLNTIGPVTLMRFGKRHELSIAISSAALAMNAAADRAAARRAAGQPEALERMYDHELHAVSRAVDAAREALPYLDVRALAIQRSRLLAMRLQDTAAQQAASGAEAAA